ncbi:MAG TPA: nucleotidyl transferase AbiEii/AbiGii toxin family protein, partial [Spirochaetota bacterium]|nr:nucleotidyl transferase AbiEii/AbiGii toxin family protein [Spirochaetota bacterium]
MEEKIVYEELYSLQDKILKIIFSLDNNFYLTGGTALHRFYLGLRYSDDLDFFISNDTLFAENINEFLDKLHESGLKYNRTVQSKDFQRIIVDDKLQLDFVNDHSIRYGKSVLKSDFKIDNIMNILSNKLSAIADR